jgi:hypothetical protein
MTMKTIKTLAASLGVLIVLTLALLPTPTFARPEFSANENVSCSECHVSPTGSGMRNASGFFFSKTLSLAASSKAIEKAFPKFGDFTPILGDHLQFGADARMMWLDTFRDPDVPANQQTWGSGFYLMQSEFYADAEVLPVLHLVGGYDMAQNAFEAYGLLDNLPAGLYVRAGRFHLPFGIDFDDHTIFTRDKMGFSAVDQDTGIEVGVRPGPVEVSVALSNGALAANSLDLDGDHYAVTARADVRFWKFALGGSYFHNTRDKLYRNLYAGWATFGIWRLALQGEYDYVSEEVAAFARPGKTTMRAGSAAVAQLDITVIDGLTLQARYTHRDPDWRIVGDFTDQVMGGVLFYPLPFLSTTFQYRHNREADDVFNDQLMAQAHFWF